MRVCIRVFGIVQGVGFRPTVKRHAEYGYMQARLGFYPV